MNNIEFKDFIQLQRGFDLPEQNRKAGNVPIVAATSIIGYHNEVKVKAPGVVTGRSGALGEVQFINEDFWPLNTTLWVKDFKGNDPKYVYYFLKTIDFKRFNSGAGVPTLNRNDLDTLEIQIHPYEIQQKIAKILSNYDDLIDNNNKRIKILEEMAQKIYKEWFVDFKYPGHETATFKDTELGKIPNDWKYKALKDVLTYSIGGGWGNEIRSGEYTESAYVIRGTDIPNCRIGNIQNCPLRYHTLSNIKSRLLQENDIIFEVSGGSKGQPVGRSLLLNKYLLEQFNDKIICASFCKLLRADSELAYPEYMYLHLLDIYNNGEIEKYQTQSTGIINFKFTVFLEKEQVLIPSNNILQLFNAQIIPIFNNISLLGYQNSILKQTRDLLLPRLMSGEIDVENLEIA